MLVQLLKRVLGDLNYYRLIFSLAMLLVLKAAFFHWLYGEIEDELPLLSKQ